MSEASDLSRDELEELEALEGFTILEGVIGDPGVQAGPEVANSFSFSSEPSMTKAEMQAVLGSLDDLEREVITRRLGMVPEQPDSAEEVALTLGLTLDELEQIENRAMAKLRPKRPVEQRRPLREQMDDMWSRVNPVYRELVETAYGLNDGKTRTVKQLAKMFGISEDEVNGRLDAAHDQLRQR